MSTNVFSFEGEIYEQKKGTPMGSLIFGLIAETVLQRLEDIAMSCYRPRVGARHVEDTFVIMNYEKCSSLHRALNNVHSEIQFIKFDRLTISTACAQNKLPQNIIQPHQRTIQHTTSVQRLLHQQICHLKRKNHALWSVVIFADASDPTRIFIKVNAE